MEEKKDKRGGKRKGAGRKPTGRKLRSVWATDEEWDLIRVYADQVRGFTDGKEDNTDNSLV